jgi:FkbM family methyltransferase
MLSEVPSVMNSVLESLPMNNKKPFADLRYLFAVLNPFTKLIPAKERILGLRFWAYKFDVVGRAIFKTETYDPLISRWLVDRYIGKSSVFIDIGANLGYFTCLLGVLAGDKGVVIAFEPEPENLELLRANVAVNGLGSVVKIFPVALGETEGTAKLNRYKKSNRGRHSILGTTGASSISVPLKTLDKVIGELLPSESIIDFMKMDVEGYEPFVLRGGQSVLGRVECMLMEYAPYLIEKSGFDLREFMLNIRSNFSHIYQVSETGFVSISVDDVLSRKDAIDLLFSKSPIAPIA